MENGTRPGVKRRGGEKREQNGDPESLESGTEPNQKGHGQSVDKSLNGNVRLNLHDDLLYTIPAAIIVLVVGLVISLKSRSKD